MEAIETGRGGRRELEEFGASICGVYFVEQPSNFGTLHREYLQDRLPHLSAWAEEWLRHR